MKLLALCLLSVSLSASLATAGNGAKGGDKCQERIEEIRNNISEWIQGGEASQLKLPKQITLAEYNKKMLDLVALSRQEPESISCTDDPEKVKIGSTYRTCIAFFENDDLNRPRIRCYSKETNGQYTGLLGLTDDDQYFQVHHEFAALANFEDQVGDPSDYPLSHNITDKMEYEWVKKLPVNSSCGTSKNCRSSSSPVSFTMDYAAKIFSSGTIPSANQLQGVWMQVGLGLLAAFDPPRSTNLSIYDPTGVRLGVNDGPVLFSFVQDNAFPNNVQETVSFFRRALPESQLAEPINVNLGTDGAHFDMSWRSNFYLNIFMHYNLNPHLKVFNNYNCRLVSGDATKMICALTVDPQNIPYNGVIGFEVYALQNTPVFFEWEQEQSKDKKNPLQWVCYEYSLSSGEEKLNGGKPVDPSNCGNGAFGGAH